MHMKRREAYVRISARFEYITTWYYAWTMEKTTRLHLPAKLLMGRCEPIPSS